MNHDEIRAMMAAYVDDELPGSERRLVEGHVAGCAECRAELAAVTAMGRQLRKTLHARAEVVDAPAGGWAVLQARMAGEPVPVAAGVSLPRSGNHSRGAADEPPGRGRALRVFSLGFAMLAVLVFVWLVIVSPLVKSAGIEAGLKKKTPTPTHVSSTANGKGKQTATPTPTDSTQSFIALSPTRLPEGVAYMDDAQLPGGARQMTFYNKKGGAFLVVTQSAAAPDGSLPDGQPATVGNLPAVSRDGLSGEVSAGGRKITYKDALGLTWLTPFKTRISIVSNLPAQKVSDFAASMGVNFTHFGASSMPIPGDGVANNSQEAVDAGLVISESHSYNDRQFIVFSQSADVAQPAPAGDPVTLSNGIKATIVRGLSGDAPAENQVFFGGRPVTFIGGGGGGGGGGGPDYTPPPTPPPSIPYTGGIRLVWTQQGTHLEVLSNLPEDQLLAYAAGMQPGDRVNNPLVTGAYVDQSILPKGGALAGYVTSVPSLSTDFYGNLSLTVTEGDGEIIESRYYSNTQFVIITTRRDTGSPLPKGDAVTIAGQPGVIQDKQNGKALLASQNENKWLVTLQDGEPRLIIGEGGGGVSKDATASDRTYPTDLDYKNGLQLTWTLDGARITLLTNLSQPRAIEAANSLTILGKDYTILNPAGGGWMSQVFADGFDVWAPTSLPDTMSGVAPGDPDTGGAGSGGANVGIKPDILYWNPDDPSQFVEVTERATKPGEVIHTPLSSTLLGQPYLVDDASGSFPFPYGGPPQTIPYKNATRITVIVDGTWIQLLTSLPRDEAMKIAASMVKGQ